MKKLLILINTILLVNVGYGQLSVIDKIAGTLIPSISGAIEKLLQSKGNKVEKVEVEKLQSEFKTKTKELTSDYTKDFKSVQLINTLFKISGNLLDDISSMRTLAKPNINEAMLATKNQKLYVETAIEFALHWRQIEAKKEQLVKEISADSDGTLQTEISKYIAKLDENLINLTTVTNLTKNPTNNMDLPTSEDYVSNLKRANEFIDKIEDQIKEINVSLSAKLKSFEYSLTKLNEAVNK